MEKVHERESDPGHEALAVSSAASGGSPIIVTQEALPIDGDGHGLSTDLSIALERERDLSPIGTRESATTDTTSDQETLRFDADEEDIAPGPDPFERSSSPSQMKRNKNASYERADELDLHKLHRISLYETQTRFYIIGGDITGTHWRMLKVDRTSGPSRLTITEDETVYSKLEMNQLLNTLEDGNRSAGGMKLLALAWGILGFIRFTDAYYMLLITKRSQVAMIGGHYIYQVDGTETFSLTTAPSSTFRANRNPEETRYLSILQNIDLQRSFYFSYSYDVTRTLQHNIIAYRSKLASGNTRLHRSADYNPMFVWNQYLLDPAIQNLKNPYDWCVPVIHGFIDQSSVNVFGRNLYVTLIARRSRFFAGARFLKRGANDLGFVANDVETEQIVADMMVTSFNISKLQPLRNPNYTSFVQYRGSIPLYWTQDSSGVSPKPAIDLNLVDPFYATSALHFDNLFERYGAPVCCLNLVKQVERTPRESKLFHQYKCAIDYLNQSLPEGKKIIYEAYDMSRMAKKRGVDVIRDLENVATRLVMATGFFHNGDAPSPETSVQNGVVRSNCIDCLDRTNAAQFVVGKRALEFQLQALGVIADPTLNYDTDLSNLFAHMFNDHGDTLASQYGGSHLVNTTDSYRKISNWQSHSRDMLESFKRYYHNSFLDSQRQEAYNLFLGNYVFVQGQPMLWDLSNDYYLHHAMPSAWTGKRRNYITWFTPDNLENRILPPVPPVDPSTASAFTKDWWHEYYRPPILSSFLRLFAYNVNSTTRYVPKRTIQGFDMSPFTVRKHVQDSTESKADKQDPSEESHEITPLSASTPPRVVGKRISSLQQWLLTPPKTRFDQTSSMPEDVDRPRLISFADPADTPMPEKVMNTPDKSQQNQWTLSQFSFNSLHPSVSDSERREYDRYVNHPLQIPLVSSQQSSADHSKRDEFEDYLLSAWGPGEANLNARSAVMDTWLKTGLMDDTLSVKHDDYEKKRYQAYRKWLQGKSLFKQIKVDPEYRGA